MKQNYLVFVALYFVINMLIFGAKSMWEWMFSIHRKFGNTYDKDSACFCRVSCGCDCSRDFGLCFHFLFCICFVFGKFLCWLQFFTRIEPNILKKIAYN